MRSPCGLPRPAREFGGGQQQLTLHDAELFEQPGDRPFRLDQTLLTKVPAINGVEATPERLARGRGLERWPSGKSGGRTGRTTREGAEMGGAAAAAGMAGA